MGKPREQRERGRKGERGREGGREAVIVPPVSDAAKLPRAVPDLSQSLSHKTGLHAATKKWWVTQFVISLCTNCHLQK